MRTGIFFHYQKGERLRDFPEALKEILCKDNVFFYDALYPSKPPSNLDLEPIPLEALSKIHSVEMIERVRGTFDFEGALLSASGTVRAAEKVQTDEIDNAFVFTGYGDHHAGTDFFGGGCYFNGVAVAVSELRRRFGARRFAIIDTDAHHGDGSWDIFQEDADLLYACFCTDPSVEENNNVNIQVPCKVSDQEYLALVRREFLPRIRTFQPEILFWNWGYDGTRGEYGDLGLTEDFHISLAKELKSSADQILKGRLIVVLCGGSRRDLACYLIPRIIGVLGEA
jgi:acetoin utilization deacetylase AcuC-like enzyme